MEAEYHGLLLGLIMHVQEDIKKHVMVIGDSDSVVQPVLLLYSAHTQRDRRTRDTVMASVAGHGLNLTPMWAHRYEQQVTDEAANGSQFQQGRFGAYPLAYEKHRFEGWTGANTRFGNCHGAPVGKVQGSRQAFTHTEQSGGTVS